MTHGAGGKAMAQLVDELFVAAFDNPAPREEERPGGVRCPRGPHGDDHRRLRRLAPLLPRRRHRLARGARDHQRRGDGRRPAASPLGVLHPRGRVPARGPPAHRRVDGEGRRATPASRSSRETRRSSRRGRGTASSSPRRASGSCRRGSSRPSGDRARAGRHRIVSGTIGDHGVAILSSREGLAFETSIESDSAPLHRLVARMVEVVPDIHVLRDPDARRSLCDAERDRAAVRRRHDARRARRFRCARRSPRPASFSASTRSTSRTRGS